MGEEKHSEEKDRLMNIKQQTSPIELKPKIYQDFDPKYPFDEKQTFQDENFWVEVYDEQKNSNMSPAKAQRIVRINRLQKNLKSKKLPDQPDDLLIYLLTTIHDRYKDYCKNEKKLDLYPTFKFELSQFTLIILEKDAEQKQQKYKRSKKQSDGIRKNILHIAAERNLVNIVGYILDFYPKLLNVTSVQELNDGNIIQKTPIDYSLDGFHDDVSAVLINAMENSRVRELFQSKDGVNAAKYKFEDYLKHKNMKKTVMAILDCLMHPDWPFLPVNLKANETEETLANSMPNMPLRYQFYYRLLDGDDRGRPAKFEDGKINEEFDYRKKSCLQLITESACKEDAMRHPVVRVLVRRKWDDYGSFRIKLYFFLYILFLINMSLSFLLPTTNQKEDFSTTEIFTLIFDIATILLAVLYVFLEIQQLIQEKWNYFKDPFNYFDVFGLLSLLTVYVLRYADKSRAEMGVACVAYMLNVLRVFKFFPAFKTIGLYAKTFAKIIVKDITKFVLVYFVIMVAFTGGCYLAVKAAAGVDKYEDINFWTILLHEVRVLTEAQAFSDKYEKFSIFIVIFLMINMFCITVILLNLLIGQVSYRYGNALNDARIQYDIDKIKLITRLEYNYFRRFNNRIHSYVDGDHHNGEEIENDLLKDWIILKEKSSTLQRNKTAVRMLLGQKIKKSKEKEVESQQEILEEIRNLKTIITTKEA